MERTIDSKWMTIEETAAYMRCSPRFLQELVAQRQIQYTKFAGKILINKNWADELLTSLATRTEPKEEIDTTILPDCDRGKIDSIIQELVDYNEHFVTALGRNLRKNLDESNYTALSEKTYGQLSRWCWPRRNSAREQWVQPKASELSNLLFGKTIDRI